MIFENEEDLKLIRKSGKLAGEVLEMLTKAVAPGISTL